VLPEELAPLEAPPDVLPLSPVDPSIAGSGFPWFEPLPAPLAHPAPINPAHANRQYDARTPLPSS
jgi:hypothetical protein